MDAESPPPPPGTITEIARVAQAFATVQRTAVEAAVGQANLRRGVNRVFLNLSLRNQSLLHRQLGMLDAMERATNEPAALGDLFRLDHLTTRMRRHAESLIILSGATPGRGWRDPVPVIDVLRAAIAEVEDYVRVDVASDSQDAVVGSRGERRDPPGRRAGRERHHVLPAHHPDRDQGRHRRQRLRGGDRGSRAGPARRRAGRDQPAPGQPARVRPGQQRSARPVRGRPAGRPARHHGLVARLPLRGHHGHRADAAQPDRAGRRGGPAGRRRPADRAGQHRRAPPGRPGQRQRLPGRPRSGGSTRAGDHLHPDRAAPARHEVTGGRA